MTFDTEEVYLAGLKVIEEAHDEEEKGKVGFLRGGSTGLLLYGKTPVGECSRKAYLRYKGIPLEKHLLNRQLMFEAGHTNEDSWANALIKAIPEGFSLKRETECPTSWLTKKGTPVTGRPDLVIFKEDSPFLGIELKCVSSIWTARDVLGDNIPKLPHMLQASHYAAILNVPWEIWYTSRVDWPVVGDWMKKTLSSIPKSYCELDAKTGEVKKILPFMKGFQLEWRGDQVFWRPRGENVWKPSLITREGIIGFYEQVENIDDAGVLPPRPKNLDATGESLSWSLCSYCKASSICDKYETSKSRWLDALQRGEHNNV